MNDFQSPMPLQRALEDYIAFYEHLRPRSVPLIEKLTSPGTRFRSPLMEIHGHDNLRHVGEALLARLDRLKIRATDRAWGLDGRTAYIRWEASFLPRGAADKIIVTGLSEIFFDQEGLVVSQSDHWDVAGQVYARLRWGARMIGWLRRKAIALLG